MKKVIIGLVVWFALFLGASHAFGQVVINAVVEPHLVAENSYSMQPFGVGAEDDDTAELHVQGTYNPQVTLHGLFIQGALNE